MGKISITISHIGEFDYHTDYDKTRPKMCCGCGAYFDSYVED